MMKTFFSIIALFAFVSGLSGHAHHLLDPNPGPPCEAKVPDNYVTTGTFIGTNITDITLDNCKYGVILGQYVEAVYFTKGLSTLNETFNMIDGCTGKVTNVWCWYMGDGKKLTTLCNVDGTPGECTTTEVIPTDRYSKMIGNLRTIPPITIHPFPGNPTPTPPPPPPSMCEGVCRPTSRRPGRVMTLGWKIGTSGTTSDTPLFINLHSNKLNIRMDVHSMRPLNITTGEPNLFHNPCGVRENPTTAPTPPPMLFGGPGRLTVRL